MLFIYFSVEFLILIFKRSHELTWFFEQFFCVLKKKTDIILEYKMAFLIRGGLILAIVCHSTWAYAASFPQGKPNFFQKNSTSKILARVFSASILTKQLHESHQIVMRRFKMTRPTKIFKKKHFMFVLSFRELMLIFAKVSQFTG